MKSTIVVVQFPEVYSTTKRHGLAPASTYFTKLGCGKS
jgi:hypothetical protein